MALIRSAGAAAVKIALSHQTTITAMAAAGLYAYFKSAELGRPDWNAVGLAALASVAGIGQSAVPQGRGKKSEIGDLVSDSGAAAPAVNADVTKTQM